MLTVVAAGHETTASALLWATYALIKHPDVQTRLRAEILAMLKETPVPGYLEIEGLSYLNNFCKEILRLYCPGNSPPLSPPSSRTAPATPSPLPPHPPPKSLQPKELTVSQPSRLPAARSRT